MRALFLSCITLMLCILTAMNTKKETTIPITKNTPVITNGANGISVKVSDIDSKISSFTRLVEITSSENKDLDLKYQVSFVSDNADENISEQLKNNPSKVSGVFSITTMGQEIYTIIVKDGIWSKGVKKLFKEQLPPPVHDPSVACSVSTVHDCVSWKIESMNAVEYLLCCLAAPGCYGSQWAGCTWDVCNNKMRYTNPVN